MPRTLWAVLCTAIWVDHLKFAYYGPEMYVLQVNRRYLYNYTFISSSLLRFAVGGMHLSGKRNCGVLVYQTNSQMPW